VAISHPVSPHFAIRCLCCNQSRELWWINWKWLEFRLGAQKIRKWLQLNGMLLWYRLVTVTSISDIYFLAPSFSRWILSL
jgi:hypothetical protein